MQLLAALLRLCSSLKQSARINNQKRLLDLLILLAAVGINGGNTKKTVVSVIYIMET